MKAGSKLKRAINAEFVVDGVAEETIEILCRQADMLEEMEQVVAREGYTVDGARGQRVAHPLLPQIVRARAALVKMLHDTLGETKREKALKATQARWGNR